MRLNATPSTACRNASGRVGNDVNSSIMWLYDTVVPIALAIMKNSTFGSTGRIVPASTASASSGNIAS